MAKYSLIGIDGNAFSVMGYTARALKKSGHPDMVRCMYDRATKGDYEDLLWVCQRYIDIANGEMEDFDDEH